VPAAAAIPQLESVRRNRLSEQVAEQLQHFILHTLKPGDKLPPERQLAESFGVSRSSVREAIRALELIGLVEPRQGMGTVIRDDSADPSVNPLTSVLMQKRRMLAELLDVRSIVEPPLARRAASHATPEQIARLDELVRRQREKLARGESTIDEDSEFHYAIATAANNAVILKVLDVLMDLLRETRERTLQVQGRPQKSIRAHELIVDAIRRRDPKGAEQAMRDHIADIKKIVLHQF
jgi:GntR family transcriptional regulator, transcriptional repressor for pyruvate dehydrogenase complex